MKVDFNSVVLCLINENEKTILLQHRDQKKSIVYPGMWGIPAGSVEKGETVIEAAKRELLEETNYVAEDAFQFFVHIYKRYDNKLIKRHCFIIRYDGEQPIVCKEGREMVFLSSEQISKLDMIPMHREIANNALDIIAYFKRVKQAI